MFKKILACLVLLILVSISLTGCYGRRGYHGCRSYDYGDSYDYGGNSDSSSSSGEFTPDDLADELVNPTSTYNILRGIGDW